jgi:cysteinyl-tRNA synthetase
MEEKFCVALANDLNMSRALGAVFDFIKKTNPILSQGQLDLEQKKYILETLEKSNVILNLLKLKECPLAPEIDRLIRDREEARRNKDWERADTVRHELARKGFEVVDTPKGPIWKEIEKIEQ